MPTNKKLFYLIVALVVSVILFINYFDISKYYFKSYSPSDVCAKEGTNSIILKEISTKYPGGQILKVSINDNRAIEAPDDWKIKIQLAGGEIVTDNFGCWLKE